MRWFLGAGRCVLAASPGGGEGSLADEKSGVQSAWILPEGLRPLDLRQSGGLAVTDFTGSVSDTPTPSSGRNPANGHLGDAVLGGRGICVDTTMGKFR